MSDQELRMDAYYYGFQKTGCPKVDLILSAVACAGKSFQHTDQWNEEAYTPSGHSGSTPVEWIQNAAMLAASPVPPAGDVEVVVYAYGPANQRRYVEPGNAFLGWHIDEATPLVDRAHVTRLTADVDRLKRIEKALCASLTVANDHCSSLAAERDGLLAAVNRLELHSHCHLQRAKIAESELTKARELIKSLCYSVDESERIQAAKDLKKWRHESGKPAAHNSDDICGQDAEAAKGHQP